MDNIYYIREIKRIYADYLAETVRMQATRKASEGLLGFSGAPGNSPTHDLFSNRLEETLQTLAAHLPSSQEASEVLRFIYDAPLGNKDNKLAYWMLQAVHALTDKLIDFLSQEDAAALVAGYKEAYPKSLRLPAQKKIIELLQLQAGDSASDNAHKRRGLFNVFKGRNK